MLSGCAFIYGVLPAGAHTCGCEYRSDKLFVSLKFTSIGGIS